MKALSLLTVLVVLLSQGAQARTDGSPSPLLLTNPKPLPVALDPDIQFRKTKLFLMTEQSPDAAKEKATKGGGGGGGGGGAGSPGGNSQTATAKSAGVAQEASITFERQYHLFGAVTKLDQHQRFGNYFDFFWRTKRPADLTVRLEYRQEKLHAHIQAQEIACGSVHGSHKTSFKVVGDDYFDGGRVVAWRCLLLENGRIAAETRSYLWQ